MSITSTAPSMASNGLPTGSSAISPVSEDSNMSNDNSSGDNDTCLQLALEGEKLCKAGTLPLNRHTRMQNKDLLFFQPSTQNFVFSLQGPPSIRNKNNVNHYPLSSSTQCHVADVEAYGWMGISAADKKHSWSRNIIYNNGNNNCFSKIFIRCISWQITKAIPKCHHKVSTHRSRPIQVQIYKAILCCKMNQSLNTV